RNTRWWRNDQVYLDFGPKQARIVPFVEAQYPTDGFEGVRWHIDQAEQAGELTRTALAQVRRYVDQAEELLDRPVPASVVSRRLEVAARRAAGSPALVRALEALAASAPVHLR